MRHILFLYNPRAGRGGVVHAANAIIAELSRGGAVVESAPLDFSTNPFDAHSTADTVVVAGGDGSLNYVINAMAARNLNLKIGLIPVGTANDFANAIGISHNPLRAATQILSGSEKPIDCGVVNGTRWINIFSFGIFTTTSQRTPAIRKRRLGRLAYIIEGIGELWHRHPIPLHIVADGEESEVEALMLLALNGRTAGGFRLAPRSSLQDGMLDCLILLNGNLLSVIFTMIRFLLGGSPSGLIQLRTSHLRIDSSVDEPTDVDGERGARFPLDIKLLAGALRMIVPAK